MLRILLLALLLSTSIPAISQGTSPTSPGVSPTSPDPGPTPTELIREAEAAYKARHFVESARLYSRALPLVEELERAGVEYNLACTQALAGDSASALDSLDRAADDGYSNRKSTEADKDLASLHTDPRWQPLLDRMAHVTADQDHRWGDAAFSTPYSPNLPDPDKLAGLAELWAEAKYGFANFWHVPQLDWDQTYRDFIPQVLATRSTAGYYRVLQRFYALLQDGHTGVYPPNQLNVSPMPLRTRLVDGHLLILGTRRSGFDLQGLHAGDEILTINGEPAIPWAQ